MPCPICKKSPDSGSDHRWCLVELFKTDAIQSVEDWEAMCKPPKPKTIVKGRIRVLLPKD